MLGLYSQISLYVSYYVNLYRNMKIFIENELSIWAAASCFAALGSEQRPLVLKTLVRAGPLGLRIG